MITDFGSFRLKDVLIIWLLILFASIVSLGFVYGAGVKTGAYVGNGTSQSITGVGFAPDVVIVIGGSANSQVSWKTKDMGTDSSLAMGIFSGTALMSGGTGITLDSDGFSVGSSAFINTNGNQSPYVCLKIDDAGDMLTGRYIGDGSNNRLVALSDPNFVTDAILIQNVSGWRTIWKVSDMGGDTSLVCYQPNANYVVDDGVGYFTVDNNSYCNTSGESYVYMVLSKTANVIHSGRWKGNGTTYAITAPNFRPDFVLTQSIFGWTDRACTRTSGSYGLTCTETKWASRMSYLYCDILDMTDVGFDAIYNTLAYLNGNNVSCFYIVLKNNVPTVAETSTANMRKRRALIW